MYNTQFLFVRLCDVEIIMSATEYSLIQIKFNKIQNFQYSFHHTAYKLYSVQYTLAVIQNMTDYVTIAVIRNPTNILNMPAFTLNYQSNVSLIVQRM